MQPRSGIYSGLISDFYQPEEEMALLDLSMPDDKLIQMLALSLDSSKDFWNTDPWRLDDNDLKALPFIFNQKPRPNLYQIEEDDYSDNRLFRGARSIKAYVTSRLAMPDLHSSKTDDYSKRQAKMLALALYQHTLDDDVDEKLGAMFINHFFRKRGFLKLRFDAMAGVDGDIVTDNVPPEDMVVDKYATYKGNPLRMHQRIRCSLDELCSRFPDKQNEIYALYGIKQGRYTQLSRECTYYETWFTYLDAKGYSREAYSHWIIDPGKLVLDKLPNPNWIYTGNDKRDREKNLLPRPPKPYIGMNYLNLGRSFIDETCVFEHAVPQQVLLDRRQKQWHKNIDYVNGRWVADKNKLSEGEATKMVNKGARTIGMIDNKEGRPLDTIFANIASQALGNEVYQSIVDTRNEVDDLLGTNAINKGATPGGKDTLGRDLLQNQQANSLQDDYVKAVAKTTQAYYAVKLQMGKVYWTKDQTIQTRDVDNNDLVLTISGAMIDENIKIGVQTDSIFPVNKGQKRQDAKDLFVANKMAAQDAYEDMGYDDAQQRAERLYKSQLDPAGYMASIEQGLDNNDAEEDIQAVIKGKQPKDRDTYDQEYLDYFDQFMTTNRFSKLKPKQQQDVTAYLALVQHIAVTQLGLQQAMLDAAGMIIPPPVQPVMPGGAPAPQAPQGGPGSVPGAVPNPLPAPPSAIPAGV